MSVKIPRLLLFDIDGTLVVSCHKKIGTETGSYLLESLSVAFGKSVKRNGVKFAGGTDPTITEDLLSTSNITRENCPDYQRKVEKAFEMLPSIAKKGIKEKRYDWKILPNVNELLSVLSKRKDVKVGLLTGNMRQLAFIKLETAGVHTEYFYNESDEKVFGAFGSDHGDRSKLVQIAKERYCKYLGVQDIDSNDMLIIGDTPKDVLCAHYNGTPCLAVDTGMYSKEDLSNADWVLDKGFLDISESVQAMVETRRK